MAAEKNRSKKVMDVVTPGRGAPSSSSRPIVVANRSILGNDPMVVGAPEVAEGAADAAAAGATTDAPSGGSQTANEQPTIVHQGKTIAPLHTSVEETTEPTAAGEAEPAAEAAEPVAAAPEEAGTSSTTTTDSEPAADDEDNEAKAEAGGENVDAAQKTAEEADAKRRQELEELVRKGTYNLPINAVHRKRSRALLVALLVLIVLAVVALDLLLDTGFIHLQGVPHTNFLQGV
jgi:hypothetical protein